MPKLLSEEQVYAALAQFFGEPKTVQVEGQGEKEVISTNHRKKGSEAPSFRTAFELPLG